MSRQIVLIVSLFALIGVNRVSAQTVEEEKRDRLWHAGWNEQKGLMVWPAGLSQQQLDVVKNRVFGEDFPNRNGVREQLREVIAEEYKKLFEALSPIKARDGWERMIRQPGGRQILTPEESWLSLEDLWVQRELLETIQRVNATVARFKRVLPKGDDNPKQRTFLSPIWEVQLNLTDKDGRTSLTGTLKNVSDRIQPLGINNALKLNVWLSDKQEKPFEFVIENESLPAGKTLDIKPLVAHILPPTLPATEIARVEQALDLRSAPIKRIEFLVLGKVGERQHKDKLVMSKFSAEAAKREDKKDGDETTNGIGRRRYLKVSETNRQLPFGIVVLADQTYLKELLEEFGQSKLRIQITQSEWSRFHGELKFEAPLPIGPKGPKLNGPADNREDANPAGLMEVSIYGVATLFEKYPADKPVPKADPANDKKPTAQSEPNWLRIHELINRSLPIPGPNGNMRTDEQRRLWDFDDGRQNGRRAAEKYFARQREGVDQRVAFAYDDERDSLAMMDIETVHARFTRNLKGLYENAADYQKKYVVAAEADIFDTMIEADRMRLPEGEGWVFELRGTSWYDAGGRGGREFLVRTLLANLQKQSKDKQLPNDLKDRISHIFLYNVWRDPDPRPSTFHFVQASLINNLMPPEMGDPKDPFLGIGMSGALAAKGANPNPPAKARARYEFVILFVWKEPPPQLSSDAKPRADDAKTWAPFFDPIEPPDTRRVNPIVRQITEIQADFIRAKIPAFDIIEKNGKLRIGTIGNAGDRDEVGPRKGIAYVPLESDRLEGSRLGLTLLFPAIDGLFPDKLAGARLALTVYPQQMVILNASFPFKDQVNEIAQALRLKGTMDVFAEAPPRFRGLVVERRIIDKDGKPLPWQLLKWEEHYKKTILPRALGDHEDPADLRLVYLPPEHELALPLPDISGLRGKYPDVRLFSIRQAIEKLKANNKLPVPGKFETPAEIPEHVLVRIVDNDVAPGRQYQYRIKVRLQNPNWVGAEADKTKYELVRRKADADIEIIESPFVEMRDVIRIPTDDFLYAIDPPADPKNPRNEIRPKPGEGLMQFQHWLPYVAIDQLREAFGDWLVADVIARRGYYLGGKQWLPIPLWSSEFNRYVLYENKNAKPREPKFGIEFDPNVWKLRLAVVDVQGGRQELRTPTRTIADESATEVLIVDEDGRLRLYSSARDANNRERLEREANWHKWVEEVEKATIHFTKPKPFDK